MAALTWQQVAGPNFSGSNDMYRTAARLTDNAFAGIGDLLAKAQAQELASRDSAVLARSLAIGNSGDYQKALSNGSLLAGVNPAQLSPKTLQELGARGGDLVNQENTLSGQAARDYTNQRTQYENLISDAARGQTAQRLGLTGPLALMSPQEQLALRQGETSLAGGQLSNENAQFRNRTQLRDDDAAQVGLTSGVNLLRQSGDRTDALTNLESMNDLQPQEFDATRKYLENSFGNLYAQPSAAPGGKPGAKPGTAGGSPYDTTFNFRGTDTPITSQPISDVLKVQQESKTTQGHSPMGAFQINKATLEDFGPRVLGKDWQNQEFTPENQEKIAEAIFNERKGGDLSKTWASLPNSSPGAYKNFTWNDMRSILAQGEVGQNLPSDAASLRLLSQASQADVSRRVAQNNSVGITADIERNLGDTRAAGELTAEAIKTQFPGADQAKLIGLVNQIQRDNPGTSAADAMSIVTRSARENKWYDSGTTSIGGGFAVDDTALKNNTESFTQGRADYNSQANKLTRDLGTKVSSAQSKYDEALQSLMQRSMQQQAQPGISTDRQERALEKAEAELKRALSKQRQDPNYRPVR